MERMLVLGNCFKPLSFRNSRVGAVLALKRKGKQTRRPAMKELGMGMTGLLTVAPAWADEAVQEIQQKASQLQTSIPSPDEVSGAVQASSGGGFFDLFADNPVLLGGLVLLAAVPFLFSFIQGGALGVKQVNAAGAIEGLTSDPSTVLVDIRNKAEIKEQGSPNLSSTKKRAILLPFTQVVQGDVKQIETFAESFSKLKQVKAESSIILLDSFGKEAPKAAKLLANLVDRVYYVKGGAIGPSGWKESGEPWKDAGQNPFSGLSLDNIAEDFKAQPTVAKAGLAAGALGLAGAVLFQEVGTAIELAAVAAAGAVFVPRLAGSTTSADASSETTRKQIKDFVKESSKDPAKAAGKVEKEAEQITSKAADKTQAAASEVASDVQSAADTAVTGNGSSLTAKAAKNQETAEKKVEETAGTLQDKAEKKVEKTAEDVKEVATDAATAAQDSAAEAKEWIEEWRKGQKK